MSSNGLPWSVATTSTSTRLVLARKTVVSAGALEAAGGGAVWLDAKQAAIRRPARAREFERRIGCMGPPDCRAAILSFSGRIHYASGVRGAASKIFLQFKNLRFEAVPERCGYKRAHKQTHGNNCEVARYAVAVAVHRRIEGTDEDED